MPEELCDVFGAATISDGTLPDGELSLRYGTYTLTTVRTESDSCLRRQTQPKSGATTNAPPSGCATSDRRPPRAYTAIAE